MSNVHEAITAHSKKQNAIVTKFTAFVGTPLLFIIKLP